MIDNAPPHGTSPSADEPLSFSIVIPTHNGRRSVRETVKSVLAQTYSHFELIIVSDGEVEVTRDLLSDSTDPKLIILGQPKGGGAAARNTGIAAAQNPWITFLDDDDLARPHWLETWASLITENTLAVTAAVLYHAHGQEPSVRPCRLAPADATMEASTILAGGFAVRREILIAIDGYDVTLHAAQNQDLGFRICDHIKSLQNAGMVRHSEAVVADVFLEQDASRSQRYGSSRGASAKVFLDRYADRLQGDSQAQASLLRLVSRAERLDGNYWASIKASLRALRVEPKKPANLRSVGAALASPILIRVSRMRQDAFHPKR